MNSGIRYLCYILTIEINELCDAVLFEKLIFNKIQPSNSLLLWNKKVNFHIHKTPPLEPKLMHLNVVLKFLKSNLILSFHPSVHLPSGLYISGLPLTNVIHFCTLHWGLRAPSSSSMCQPSPFDLL